MNRLFLGLLSVAAIALVVSQAIANGTNSQANPANAADNGGVVIIETYTSSSSVVTPAANNDMQPLPGDPGVEVAPLDSSASQPVVVEEGVLIQETEDGE